MSHYGSMALDFSDEQGMILDSAREFCRDQSDIAAVRALLSTDTGFNPEVWSAMVDLGWLGLAIDESYGGSGLGIGSTVPLAECMGRSLLSTPFFSSTLAAQLLLRAGTSDLKERYLPEIATGRIATPALIENEDWGAPGFACTAEPDGEGFVLSGSKWFVTDATVAELFVVAVTCAGEKTLVVVEREQLADSAVTSQTLIDETKRAGRVDLSGVRVAAEAMLDASATESALHDVRLLGALLAAAEASGSTAACLDTVVDYLKTRKQFGKLIGSYQALKHPTVDILCGLDSARSFIYHAASVVTDSALSSDAEIACRMAKAQATDALLFAGDRAVQFHGGMGFTYECDAQLYIRRAQWIQQHYGDAYHHRKRLAPLLLDA